MADIFQALPENLNVLRLAGVRHLFAPSSLTDPAPLSYTPLEAEPWATFLTKAPRNALSIWTYAELASDWTGTPHEGRKRLWTTLIKALSFPKGSLGFFPFSLEGAEDHSLVAPEFFLCIARIAPRSIVSFGVPHEHPSLSLPAFVSHELGYSPLLYHAPHPSELLAMDNAQLHEFTATLRGLLLQET